ncbi:MAG: DNA adenine methylase [Planctomycetota bacterium]
MSELTRLLPWFGAKVDLAREIVNQASVSNAGGTRRPSFVGVPFVGGYSVPLAFARAGVRSILCGDLHRDLQNAARCLASEHGPWIVERLRSIPMSESSFGVSMGARVRSVAVLDDLDSAPTVDHAARAVAWMATEWMGNNGTAGTTSEPHFNVRFDDGGGDPSTRLRNFGDGLMGAVELLRCMTHKCEDFGVTLGRIKDGPNVAIYADPPYLTKTRSSGDYLHDFDESDGDGLFGGGGERDEHDRLAAALNGFDEARVVVSYYPHERLDKLYPGPHDGGRWRRIAIPCPNRSQAASGGDVETVIELLLVNGEVAPPVLKDAMVLGFGVGA